MVNLIGEKIKNKALGVGTIISVEGKYITIEFPSKISKFTYPMAFEKFLVPVDPKISEAINEELNAAIEKEAQKKAEERARKAAEEQARIAALRDRENKKSVRKTGTVRNEYRVKRGLGQSLTYLVFQGDTYDEECRDQFIWAPKYTKSCSCQAKL